MGRDLHEGQTQVGAVSWSVDTDGRAYLSQNRSGDDQFPHVVVDRHGIEWTVREVSTPQTWAKSQQCLVLNSRECVRRLWNYPRHWRTLDADTLLRLGQAD